MEVFGMVVLDRILRFLANIYSPSHVVYSAIGIFMMILAIQEKPYMLIGLFLTRKFKPAEHNHKYAVLIPARNEEPVIANLIKSIKRQDYPQ